MRSKLALFTGIVVVLVTSYTLFAQRDAREDISIRAKAFTPAALHVKKGQAVIWKNNDNADHTVDAEDGSFSSGTIKSGKTYSHTFKKAGKYAYACRLHPRMKGTIVVE